MKNAYIYIYISEWGIPERDIWSLCVMLSGHLPGWMRCSRVVVVVVAAGVILKIHIQIWIIPIGWIQNTYLNLNNAHRMNIILYSSDRHYWELIAFYILPMAIIENLSHFIFFRWALLRIYRIYILPIGIIENLSHFIFFRWALFIIYCIFTPYYYSLLLPLILMTP